MGITYCPSYLFACGGFSSFIILLLNEGGKRERDEVLTHICISRKPRFFSLSFTHTHTHTRTLSLPLSLSLSLNFILEQIGTHLLTQKRLSVDNVTNISLEYFFFTTIEKKATANIFMSDYEHSIFGLKST